MPRRGATTRELDAARKMGKHCLTSLLDIPAAFSNIGSPEARIGRHYVGVERFLTGLVRRLVSLLALNAFSDYRLGFSENRRFASLVEVLTQSQARHRECAILTEAAAESLRAASNGEDLAVAGSTLSVTNQSLDQLCSTTPT